MKNYEKSYRTQNKMHFLKNAFFRKYGLLNHSIADFFVTGVRELQKKNLPCRYKHSGSGGILNYFVMLLGCQKRRYA